MSYISRPSLCLESFPKDIYLVIFLCLSQIFDKCLFLVPRAQQPFPGSKEYWWIPAGLLQLSTSPGTPPNQAHKSCPTHIQKAPWAVTERVHFLKTLLKIKSKVYRGKHKYHHGAICSSKEIVKITSPVTERQSRNNDNCVIVLKILLWGSLSIMSTGSGPPV